MDRVKCIGPYLLLGLVAHHPLDRRAYVGDGATCIEDRDDIGGVLYQGAEAFLALFYNLLNLLALGYVADESEHQTPAVLHGVAQVYGVERYLDRDLLTVLAHCGQIQNNVGVDVGSVACIPVAGHARLALGLEAFWDDHGPTVVACLRGGVSEDLSRGRVPQD